MTRTMGTRRAALLVGAAVAAAATLSGCGAGQIAETALKNPSVYGVNTDAADGSLSIRGLAVAYNGPEGYQAGAAAPLELHLFNQTQRPITVTISSAPSDQQGEGILSARGVNLIGPAPSSTATAPIAEPSGSRDSAVPIPTGEAAPTSGPSAEPSANVAPAPGGGGVGAPARITIEPLGTVDFRPGDSPSLQIVGLSGVLRPGNSVNLVFEFGSGQPLVVQAPVAVPLSPAPRGSAEQSDELSTETDHE